MKREKSAMLMGAACGLLLALCAVSLCVGSFPLSLFQIGEILQGGLAGEMPARVFWTLRVPRTAVGLLAGLVLGYVWILVQELLDKSLKVAFINGIQKIHIFALCALVYHEVKNISVPCGYGDKLQIFVIRNIIYKLGVALWRQCSVVLNYGFGGCFCRSVTLCKRRHSR